MVLWLAHSVPEGDAEALRDWLPVTEAQPEADAEPQALGGCEALGLALAEAHCEDVPLAHGEALAGALAHPLGVPVAH